MTVLSKSAPHTLRGFTCYEVGHTWNSSCLHAWKDIAKATYQSAFKIYLPIYLVTYALQMQKKQKLRDRIQRLLKTIPHLLRSTVFLGTNGVSFIVLFCTWRRLLGSFTFLSSGFVPSFVASAFSVSLERPSRRTLLAVYMATVAMETLFEMLKIRGLVYPLPYGEVLLFSVASSVLLYLYRLGKTEGILNLIVKHLLGVGNNKDEIKESDKSIPDHSKSAGYSISKFLLGKHSTCPHEQPSCVLNALKNFFRVFGSTWGLVSLFQLPKLPKLKRPPRVAVFAGLMPLIYHISSCVIRRITREPQSPEHAAVAGALTGLALLVWRKRSLPLYLIGKLCEMALIKNGFKYWEIPLYAVSTALVFHAAVFEPHALRPAYWSFLLTLTKGKFAEMNRPLLDVFGVNSSKLNPDFWPNFDPKVTDLSLGPGQMRRRLLAGSES